MDKIARYLLIALSLFGTYAGVKLTISHLQTGETCPVVAVIPACYIVLAGYTIILLSTVFREKLKTALKKTGWIFYLGWFPVFALAAFGVTLELAGQHICPISAGGIPQCFYSFTMISLCLVFFLLLQKSEKTAL